MSSRVSGGGCAHPQSERWQAILMWRCCLCFRWFWGDKRLTPKTDIYGGQA